MFGGALSLDMIRRISILQKMTNKGVNKLQLADVTGDANLGAQDMLNNLSGELIPNKKALKRLNPLSEKDANKRAAENIREELRRILILRIIVKAMFLILLTQ